MPTRAEAEAALNLIIRKVPSLAGQSARAIRRPNDKIMLKAAAAICEEAIGATGLTARERETLSKIVTGMEDETRHLTIRVRVSPEEFEDLKTRRIEAGYTDLSKFVRKILFP